MSSPVYRKPSDLPSQVPIFPLEGVLLFPNGNLPLNIFEPRYLNMIDDAMYSHRLIAMVQPLSGQSGLETPDICKVGCVGRITSYAETNDGRYMITLTGICRFTIIEELTPQKPYRVASVNYEPFQSDMKSVDPTRDLCSRKELTKALKAYLSNNAMKTDWTAVTDAPIETLINTLAAGCPFSSAEKQALLEAPVIHDRFKTLISLLKMNATGHGGTLQ